jgi:hypothetical protein
LDDDGELGVPDVDNCLLDSDGILLCTACSSGRINKSPSFTWLGRRPCVGARYASGGAISNSAPFKGTVDSLETSLIPPEDSTREWKVTGREVGELGGESDGLG